MSGKPGGYVGQVVDGVDRSGGGRAGKIFSNGVAVTGVWLGEVFVLHGFSRRSNRFEVRRIESWGIPGVLMCRFG